MNMENATPDMSSSGQGESQVSQPSQAPAGMSGQGTENNQVSGQGSVDPNFVNEFHQQKTHFNQKITEMGQRNSELQRQLETYQSQQEQQRQNLARALGLVQEDNSPDVLSSIVDDPQYLERIIDERTQKMLQPVQEQLSFKEKEEILANQVNEKWRIKQQMKELGFFGDDFIEKVADLNSRLGQTIFEKKQRLENDPTLNDAQRRQMKMEINSDLSKFFDKHDGYQGVVERNIGAMFLQDPESFVRTMAQSYNQNQMNVNRARGFSSAMAGASTQGNTGNSGPSSYASESVYR